MSEAGWQPIDSAPSQIGDCEIIDTPSARVVVASDVDDEAFFVLLAEADEHGFHQPIGWAPVVHPPVLPDHRNARETLASRRTGGSVDFAYAGINATLTAGFSLYADGRCAEIFLNTDRSQGDFEANVRDAGILASYALQHGATIETLCAGVTHEEDGRGSSLVGMALHLVKEEIDRLRGEASPPDPAPLGRDPGGLPPAGAGGAVERRDGADRASSSELEPSMAQGAQDAPSLDPADAKELQNDGDPIAAAGDVWPYCERCRCRHATSDRCPVPDAAGRRQTQLLAPARSARPTDGRDSFSDERGEAAP